jgi:CPA1 family monovalent cation:H+ antiporter
MVGEKIPLSWRHIMVWSGLRGALSMAMVIGLDPAMPYRNLLTIMTFAVVLFSLIGQGLTIKMMVKKMGLAAE